MTEAFSEVHSKSEGRKAEQIADFILNPKKFAWITDRTLHRLSMNFIDRQEKKKAKLFMETNEYPGETKIGLIEDLCVLAEKEHWTVEDAHLFEDMIISVFKRSHETDYIKFIKTINKMVSPEILNNVDILSYYASGRLDYLKTMFRSKKDFVQRALCSLLARKIYDNNLSNYWMSKKGNGKSGNREVMNDISTETKRIIVRIILLAKLGRNIMINTVAAHQDMFLVSEANVDPSNTYYILYDKKDDFVVQDTIDGKRICDVAFYTNSIVVNLTYRCIKNAQGIYAKDILM